MTDPSSIILLLLMGIPLLFGGVFVFLGQTTLRRFFYVLLAIHSAGLLSLLMLGDHDFSTTLVFFNEAITFSITATPTILFILCLAGLWLLAWQHRLPLAFFPARVHAIFISVALSAGCLAFYSGQFMMRYIALEVVGLLVALTAIVSFANLIPFGVIFLILRLGDLSMLAAILILYQPARTLDIITMITQAAQMPFNSQAWVLAGFLFAVIVKVALFPMGGWLQIARENKQFITIWISAILMPAMGYYLLYRIAPIFQYQSVFQIVTLVLTSAMLLAIMLVSYLRVIPFSPFMLLNGVLSAMAILLAAYLAPALVSLYLFIALAARIVLLYQERVQVSLPPLGSALLLLALNTAFLLAGCQQLPMPAIIAWMALTVLASAWLYLMGKRDLTAKTLQQVLVHPEERLPLTLFTYEIAAWLYHQLEIGVFHDGLVKVRDGFLQAADWVYTNIEGGMEKIWTKLGSGLIRISKSALRQEEQVSHKANEGIQTALRSIDKQEIQAAAKEIRWDLIWIPVVLVVILVYLMMG
jgi:hypothetical protein